MEFCKLRLLGLAGDQRGVSAVEFALMLPLMVALYLGVVEISQGIAAHRKMTMTTRTVADLVSQTSNVANTYMTNALNAATAVMAPFPDSKLKITVSSIKIDRRQGDRELERHQERHRAGEGLHGDAAGGARRRQRFADLERGRVRLHADHRLCHQRHADAEGQPLHASAAVDLRHSRKRRDNLLLNYGIGSDVVDLIFSIAKRDVTFFSGTVAISFL